VKKYELFSFVTGEKQANFYDQPQCGGFREFRPPCPTVLDVV
jgi:hypothetical protein